WIFFFLQIRRGYFRSLGEEEVFEFCRRVSMLLQTKEFGADTVSCLQRLRFVIFSTKKPRGEDDVWILVLTYVDMQIVLTTISRHRHCSYVTQANGKGELRQVRTRVLELLETWQVLEDPDIRLLLPILSRTIVLEPHMMLTEEQVISMNKRLARWLRYLGAAQTASNTSTSFFSISRGRQQSSLLELDGCVSSDFFTVLCQAQPPSDAHWLCVQAFSMLRLWLSKTRPQLDLGLLFFGFFFRKLIQPRSRQALLIWKECSQNRTVEECWHNVSKRCVSKCVEEALAVLELLCQSDATLIPTVLASSQRLMSWLRLVSPQHTRLLLSILSFSLKHGIWFGLHSTPHYSLFSQFSTVITFLLGTIITIDFHTSFGLHLSQSSTYLLFGSLEMLHALLDLPCLAAALQLLRYHSRSSITIFSTPMPPDLLLLQCFSVFVMHVQVDRQLISSMLNFNVHILVLCKSKIWRSDPVARVECRQGCGVVKNTLCWFPALIWKAVTGLSVRWAKRPLLVRRGRSHANGREIYNTGVRTWDTDPSPPH
uniref:Uncharacterized protein n=1 Tax=Eptatretus burgeri TaxID=7764 RepID=A0A8C4NH16_EPTBU